MYDGDNRATRPCLTSQDCHQRSDEVDSGFKTDLVSDGAVEGGSYGATPEECNCLEGHDLTSKIVREALLQLGGETCEPHRHSGVGSETTNDAAASDSTGTFPAARRPPASITSPVQARC